MVRLGLVPSRGVGRCATEGAVAIVILELVRCMVHRNVGDVAVSAIGLGGVNWSYPKQSEDGLSVQTIHAALDAGVTLIDTALAYTTATVESHNESLIARALRGHPKRDDVLVATKGGHYRRGDECPVDGRPEVLRAHCEISLRTLEVECIGLYQLHWPDPAVPIAESMGALAKLQEEGKIRMLGVSNVSVAQLEEARSVVEVVSVQNRFSPLCPESRPVLRYCAEEGLAFLPWFPLGGLAASRELGGLLPAFREVAAARSVSIQRIVLAWHLAQAPVVIPIPGARRPESIRDSAEAADLLLADDELAMLNAGLGGCGGRGDA